MNMDNELSNQHFYFIKSQWFDILRNSWRCYDEWWCHDLSYAIPTSGKQSIVYQSCDCHMPGVNEEASNHFPGNSAWTNIFWWLRLILEHTNSRLLFTFWLFRIDPYLVSNNDVVDQIELTSVEFLEQFFAPFNTNQFLSFAQIVWDPTTVKFPYFQEVM